MKIFMTGFIAVVIAVLALPALAFAHVVVTPGQAGIGQRTLFNLSVPNEKEIATTAIKLEIPGGLENVQPTVTAGWNISTQKDGDTIKSITWTGDIPVGQRADLTFKAQTPATAGELDWKAYQTYADGTVVSWDQKASKSDDHEGSEKGPYSATQITDDLDSESTNSGGHTGNDASNKATVALALSAAALALSVAGLLLRRQR